MESNYELFREKKDLLSEDTTWMDIHGLIEVRKGTRGSIKKKRKKVSNSEILVVNCLS